MITVELLRLLGAVAGLVVVLLIVVARAFCYVHGLKVAADLAVKFPRRHITVTDRGIDIWPESANGGAFDGSGATSDEHALGSDVEGSSEAGLSLRGNLDGSGFVRAVSQLARRHSTGSHRR